MHTPILVTINKHGIKTSADARGSFELEAFGQDPDPNDSALVGTGLVRS